MFCYFLFNGLFLTAENAEDDEKLHMQKERPCYKKKCLSSICVKRLCQNAVTIVDSVNYREKLHHSPESIYIYQASMTDETITRVQAITDISTRAEICTSLTGSKKC